MTIPSPYNFVPLSKQVVFPGKTWEKTVSHDVPLKEGLSGSIDVTINAESPLYIRNGGKWPDQARKNPNSELQDFFTAEINGKEHYIIPGTSIKGMIRSVCEIASFGKLDKFSDHRYSVRDLNYSKYQEKLTDTVYDEKQGKKKIGYKSKVKSGWLIDGWKLIPCKHARVEAQDLEHYHRNNPNILGKQNAIKKYENWGHFLEAVDFDPQTGWFSHSCGQLYYTKAENLGNGKKEGYIVFTGQPFRRGYNKYKKRKMGKHMEFIFYDNSSNQIDVSHLKKDFEFIHSDEKCNPNDEWKYWKKEMKNEDGTVPVFYLENDDGSIHSMGLAMMYRLPYNCTIGDTIEHTSPDHLKKKPDLADLIFGYTHTEEKKGGKETHTLKGRVQFSHFINWNSSVKIEHDKKPKKTVMGSPRPTFYPNYLVQSGETVNTYTTFMDDTAKIRGWKRYPAEERNPEYPPVPRKKNGELNTDVMTMLRPLPKGVSFTGNIRFHNLRPEELGALLWSLTWGGNTNCQHQIGMGKALGLGRVTLNLSQINLIPNDPTVSTPDRNKLIDRYKSFMESRINNWETSEQITELLAMADVTRESNVPLKYPVLDPENKRNDFADFKKNDKKTGPKQALQKYSDHLRRKQ